MSRTPQSRRVHPWLGRGVMAALLSTALAGCQADFDLSPPRPYHCERTGTSAPCPAGSICGLEGTCHPATEEAAFLCQTDGDCAASWRCGLDGRCHDRAKAEAYACATSADCEGGWHCGLEQVCHAPTVAIDYLCLDDGQCEQGWRCGPGGRCLDPQLDALRPDQTAGPLSAQRLSPLFTVGAPEQVAVGEAEIDGSGREYRVVSTYANGRWSLARWGRLGLVAPDGGAAVAQTVVAQLSPQVHATGLAVHDRDAYLLGDGGLWQLRWDLDGGQLTPLSTTVAGTSLRLEEGAAPAAVVVGSAGYSVVDLRTQAVRGPFTLPAGQPILDLTTVAEYGSSTPEALLAAGPQGMLIAIDGGTSSSAVWQAFDVPSFPNAACGADLDGGLKVVKIHGDLAPAVLVEAVPWANPSSPVRYVALLLSGPPQPSACPPPALQFFTSPPPGGFNTLGLSLGPCLACPPGGVLLEALPDGYPFFYDFAGEVRSMQTRCAMPAGAGTRVERTFDVSATCELTEVPSRSSLGTDVTFAQQSRWGIYRADGWYDTTWRYTHTGHGYALAGAHGQLWSLSSLRTLEHPFTLDAVPDAVIGSGASLAAYRGLFGAVGTVARPDPLAGMVNEELDAGVAPLSTVAGKPGWAVLPTAGYTTLVQFEVRASVVPGAPLLARSEATVPILQLPVHAAAAPLPDGGTELLVSRFDSLYAADISGVEGGAAPAATLQLKLLPRPESPIVSIATLPPDPDAGTLLSGYVLTRNGLFAFRAPGQSRWQAEPVTLPDGEWLELWTDGERGRVGYRDGTVLSLPSRVRIAEPLPNGATVSDYAVFCTQPFALGSSGLYRLAGNPDGGPVGQWLPEPLDGLLPPGVDPGFAGGALHVVGAELDVFTAYGAVLRLKSPGCQTP